MELRDMANVIRKRGWLITAIVLLAGIIAGAVSQWVIPPTYEASTKLIVNKAAEEGMPAVNWDTVTVNIQLISTYKEIIRTSAVMDEVLNLRPEIDMTSEDLIDAVSVESANDTQVMTVIAEADSYELAALIANTVAEVFRNKVVEIMEVDNVTVLATAPDLEDPLPVSPNRTFNIAVAMVLAALFAFGLAFLLEQLDETIRNEADAREALGLPILAAIEPISKKDVSNHRAARTARKAGDNVYVTTQSNS